MPGDAPIVVNSAGCGAAMKDYGSIVGTDAAAAVRRPVVDANEWLAERVDLLPRRSGDRPRVIVQDPCHLRHVQRIDAPVRTLLGHVADVVELDDDGLCCGAGGAYSALQPELAAEIRDRKLAAIDRASARVGRRRGQCQPGMLDAPVRRAGRAWCRCPIPSTSWPMHSVAEWADERLRSAGRAAGSDRRELDELAFDRCAKPWRTARSNGPRATRR